MGHLGPCICRYTLSGRDEKTLMKLIVHVDTDIVVGVHMICLCLHSAPASPFKAAAVLSLELVSLDLVVQVGPDSPEIIQGIAIALKGHATKKQFDSTVGVHPSASPPPISTPFSNAIASSKMQR
eukprot:1155038-Pelagomonas_calceolata.AAC.3